MRKLFVADRETGSRIEEIDNILEGLSLIDKFENDDKLEGVYTEEFYDIVDDDYCTVDINNEIKSELINTKWGNLSEHQKELLFYYFLYNVVDHNGNNIQIGRGILDFEFDLSIPCLVDVDAYFVEDDEVFYNPIA